MGSRVEAKCACGYVTEVPTGCGLAGPIPDYFPALCRRCGEVVAADITTFPPVCSRCGEGAQFYDAPGLQLEKGRRTVLDERTVTDSAIRHRLNDGVYRCPKCGEFGLRFGFGGRSWD